MPVAASIRSLAVASIVFGGGCAVGSSAPASTPASAATIARSTVAEPPSSSFDLGPALATIAAAGIDLEAPLHAWDPMRCSDEPRREMVGDVDPRLIESFILIEHHARDARLRRAALHRHIELRLRRCELGDAATLLESYLLDDERDPNVVWTAVMLTDALTLAWMQAGDPAEIIAASERLEAWVRRAPSLAVWTHPDAAELRRAIVVLGSSLLVRSCRADGSYYCDGVRDPIADLYRHCAEEFAELARLFPNDENAAPLRNHAEALREASEQSGC